MRSLVFLAAAVSGLLAATAAQALDKGPGQSYCDRQRQQCIQRCRGEQLCTSHCTLYSCGSRFPVAGAATLGTAGAAQPDKLQQPQPTKGLEAAPQQ